MIAYRKSIGTSVIRQSDGLVISSSDTENFLEYQEWLSFGNIPDPELINLSTQAQLALDKSDITILRCVEHSVSVPSEWVTYRTALRDIVNGSDTTSTELPEQPDYPVGT